VRLPRGTRLRLGAIPFETAESAALVPARLVRVATSSRAGLVDDTEANGRAGLAFSAFGAPAEAGSRLYLGFDAPLPPGVSLALTFDLFEDYRDARGGRVERGAHGGEPVDLVPSAELAWEVYGNGAWSPLGVLADETLGLFLSGPLRFLGPAAMERRDLPPLATGLFWLRATVVRPGYELPPRIESVRLDAVPALQRDTASEAVELSADGGASLAIPDPGYLVLQRGDQHQVQVREAEGLWRDRQDAAVRIAGESAFLDFDDPPPAGEGNVRLVSWLPGFEPRRLLGRGNGLPGQTFRLAASGLAELRLQVREEGGLWRDWQEAVDLDASGPGSYRYRLDREAGVIVCGDGIEGAVLPAAETENVRVVTLRTGGGRSGNLAAGAEVRLDRPQAGFAALQLELPAAAAGGADGETLAEAKERARAELRARSRAVTDEDFEALARATPGLRVARARALPLFTPGLAGYPEQQAPATVTVVVVPFSESDEPLPSPGFLQTVCRHLDRHRLITTRLRVVGPEYVCVGVEADVALELDARPSLVLERIQAALDGFLHPLRGGPAGDGWPFGRPVYISEIHEVLENVDGVDCVERVVLRPQRGSARRDVQGSLVIAPLSLVCPGDHSIGFVSREDVCPVKGGCP
jgi:uncharacterized phage protein gp47/JayE